MDLYANIALHHGEELFADEMNRYGKDGYQNLLDASSIEIPPGERKLIHTGINVAIPRGYYGRVAPRSGLALKHGIDTLAGVIDSDYRGEVGVIMINHGDKSFFVTHEMRVAQLVVEKIAHCIIEEVEELDDTARGEGKYGSTGT